MYMYVYSLEYHFARRTSERLYVSLSVRRPFIPKTITFISEINRSSAQTLENK